LPQLLLRVVTTLAGLADAPCDAALFGRVKQRLELGLKNEPGTRAEELASYERLACLTREFVHADARREALHALTPADVQARVAVLLTAPGGLEANMYVGGNLAAAEAESLFDQLVAALRAPPAVPAAARAVEECVLLPEAKWAVRAVPARNADDANCAVQAYWQLGANEPKLNALMSLLEHIMYEPLFDALRTKQQLGYSVYVSARNTNQMLGLLIGVVSATATPAAIEAAVAAFLLTFLDSLDRMAPEAYARNVAACATNRMVDDHNMQEEATRYFAEIEAGLYEFGRAEEEAAAIHLVTQAELAHWARDTMLPTTGGRRLSVHVYKGALTVGPPPEGATPINDPSAHRAALASHKPTRNPLPPLSAAV
jgi:secreted Zn-dependent insulinase-like peptidase